MPKQVIRETQLAQRAQLTEDKRRQLAIAAQTHLIDSELFRESGCIALYSPMRGEVATGQIFSASRQAGKVSCYPRVDGEQMAFFEVSDLAMLKKRAFGLLEPPAEKEVPVTDLDLIIVPGVAFDRSGHRLGYGKGFYDRALHAVGFSGRMVGLCYGFQLLEKLPSESHDVPMDYLLTEHGLFFPRRS